MFQFFLVYSMLENSFNLLSCLVFCYNICKGVMHIPYLPFLYENQNEASKQENANSFWEVPYSIITLNDVGFQFPL